MKRMHESNCKLCNATHSNMCPECCGTLCLVKYWTEEQNKHRILSKDKSVTENKKGLIPHVQT